MLLARITLNIVYRITYPFLPVIARGLGVDLTSAGLLVTARATGGLASPLFGSFSDAWGRKRLMLIGLTFLIIGAAICATLPLYTAFLAAFVIFGLSKAAYDPAMQAYIGDHVPYERRGRVIGITELSWAGAWLIGVPTAGWLIAHSGWQAPFALLAILGVAGLALIAWILPGNTPALRPLRSCQPSVGLRPRRSAVIHNRNLLAALGVTFLIVLANEITFIVYGAWMESRFGLSVVSLGVASIVIGLAETVGEFCSATFVDRWGKRRSVLAGLLLLAVAYGTLPMLGHQLAWTLGGLAFLFIAFEFTIVSFLPLMSELTPEARAAALSSNIAAGTMARMIGSVSGTALFARTGLLGSNATASVIASLLAFSVLWIFVQEKSNRFSEPVRS
jgi:predicted MFS family arabinose efflux permease